MERDAPIPMTNITVVNTRTETLRLHFSLSMPKATVTSIREMEEEMAAKKTRMKKIREKIVPRGMLSNTAGRVMNMSPGPSPGAKPKANTAGRMANPAMMATSESREGISKASFSRSSCLLR